MSEPKHIREIIEQTGKLWKLCPVCGSRDPDVRLPEGFDDETQGDPCTHPWHDREEEA